MQSADSTKEGAKQSNLENQYVPRSLQGLLLLEEFQDNKTKEKVCKKILCF